MCTRFLYTAVECACGTLQTNRQIKSSCLTKRIATVQVIQISLLCCHVLHPNNCAAVFNHIRSTVKRQLYTDKDSRWVHYESSVRSRILLSLAEWQACMLSDFQCQLHAFIQM